MALSKTQTKRLGGLLQVTFNNELPQQVTNELVEKGFVKTDNGNTSLTEKGLDERKRLTTLAGLNITYQGKKSDT
tara:strand:+ start:1639 stop:1863 length:225 start_codon:yes stop_codon:yes gene_type:complete